MRHEWKYCEHTDGCNDGSMFHVRYTLTITLIKKNSRNNKHKTGNCLDRLQAAVMGKTLEMLLP
jgi:hypothetical protein